MRAPKLESKKIDLSPTIHIRFEGGDWMKMAFQQSEFDGATWWTVVISSSYGNWQYAWSESGMGNRDIFSFMTSWASGNYLQQKFRHKEQEKYDHELTCKKIAKHIREEFPNYWSNKEEVDKLRAELSDFKDEDLKSDETFWYSLPHYKKLYELMGEELHHFIVFSSSKSQDFFFKKMFPKFFPEIRKIAKLKEKERKKEVKNASPDLRNSTDNANLCASNMHTECNNQTH